MSILQEYESIRRNIGEIKYKAIEEYLAEHTELFLSDIYYKESVWKDFENWNNEKNKSIIYIAESGEEYSENDIMSEVMEFVNNGNIKSFQKLEKDILTLVLYDYVLNLLTWEHPNTILDQINDDEEKAIIKMYNDFGR